jgi:hypothetical protein
MYSDFVLRNDLFNLLENRDDYNKANLDELEKKASDPDINYKDFVNICRKIFYFDKNHWIYTNHKALNRQPFNEMYPTARGLHSFRRYFSQMAHQHRAKNGNEKFDKEGLVIIEKFANARWLRAAREEIEAFPISVNKQPFNILFKNKDVASTLNKISEKTYEHIIKCLGGETPEIRKKFEENTFAQRVHNKPGDGDHQKYAHVDTFFPAVKWWWFPDEVKLEHGPFHYAKGSCYPTDTYLDWIFHESMNIVEGKYEKWKGKDHMEGSYRASEEELIAMNFKLEPITVKANTLVIANVAGFHSRGEVETEYTRNAIHGSIRIDKPFEW